MMSGGYGWGVADIDDRRIRHIFLKWGIGAKEGRYYTLYQLWPKQYHYVNIDLVVNCKFFLFFTCFSIRVFVF